LSHPLEAVPWINWNDALAHLPDARWIAAKVPESRIVLRCASFEPMVEATRAGLGAILLYRAQGELSRLDVLRLSRLLRREIAPFPRGAIYLAGHRALRHVPRVAAVWDFLLDALGTG
jgi:DNA-binding transcriptional LysR family regulator